MRGRVAGNCRPLNLLSLILPCAGITVIVVISQRRSPHMHNSASGVFLASHALAISQSPEA